MRILNMSANCTSFKIITFTYVYNTIFFLMAWVNKKMIFACLHVTCVNYGYHGSDRYEVPNTGNRKTLISSRKQLM